MDKSQFAAHSQYTVTLKDAQGVARPANFYVHRCLEQFMIVRFAADGGLNKLEYDDVLRIVTAAPVPAERRYHVPLALLDERVWKDRRSMEHYASRPQSGK